MSPSPTTNPVPDDRLQAVLSDCGHLAHRLAVMLEGVHGRLDGAPEIDAVDAAAAQPAGLFALAFDTRSTLRGAIEAQANEIYDDLVWKEGNTNTGHVYTVRTSLPSVAVMLEGVLFALAFDTRSTLRGAIEAMEALHNRL